MKYVFMGIIVFIGFSCSNTSNPKKKCDNNYTRGLSCENNVIYDYDFNGDGCLEKIEFENCLKEGEICIDGTSECIPDNCTNECDIVGSFCKDENTISTCKKSENNSCYEYSSDISCNNNEICKKGECILKLIYCMDNESVCTDKASCVELEAGVKVCSCNSGYVLNENYSSINDYCTDINECATDNGGCEQNCTNINGGFKCSCENGYILNTDELSCDDIDDCVSNPCQNGGICSDAGINSYNCDCTGTGYKGTSCDIDIDECAMNKGGCEQNCTNINGGFKCSCDNGYTLNTDELSCDDIDDCVSNPCQNGGICSDAGINSYNCDCTGTGYKGANCDIDIDECADNTYDCDDDEYCENTIPDYNCNSCGCNTSNTVNGDAFCNSRGECNCLPMFEGDTCEDERHLMVFATNSSYNANLGGLSGADTKCNENANNPDNIRYYKALLGASTRYLSSSDWPLKASLKYYRAKDNKYVTYVEGSGKFHFDFGNYIYHNSWDANDDDKVWTGLNGDFSVSNNNCNNWTSNNDGLSEVNVGQVDRKNSEMLHVRTKKCSTSRRLYCVEQVCSEGETYNISLASDKKHGVCE